MMAMDSDNPLPTKYTEGHEIESAFNFCSCVAGELLTIISILEFQVNFYS